MIRTALGIAVAAALCGSSTAEAVYVNADGTGQALIYPYYTVQSTPGGAFNTYVSVVNAANDNKVLRVRFRESRAGREVASFNLYLGRNDVWTGALVPTPQGTRLITQDFSCTDPAFSGDPAGIDFTNAFYSGANADAAGAGLDRTREGYLEILEMATVTGSSQGPMTHTTAGVPSNCAAVRPLPGADAASPTGGLSGTLTLINVADGSDYSMNAEALAELGTRAFYRPPSDAYPAFDAAEIDPVSVVAANGFMYRSHWGRSIDAISGALMRQAAYAEYVVEPATASHTDVAITFPTRPFLVGASAAAPFTSVAPWSASCSTGEPMGITVFNRAQAGALLGPSNFPGLPLNQPFACATAAIAGVENGTATAKVLGSSSLGLSDGRIAINASFQSGWLVFQPGPVNQSNALVTSQTLTSLASSTRTSIATGAVTTGAHTHLGLPMTGVVVRQLKNGLLSCGSASCQGNYGSAFPLKYRRSVTAAP
jgi:hypothetical protein